MSFKNILRNHFFLILFIVLYFSAIGVKIISHPPPFYDWDEAIYAQVGREMVEAPSLIPLWQGKYWLDKPPLPPLFYGLIIAVAPFLQPEISARLANFLINALLLIFIYWFYLKAAGNKLIALTTVIMTAFTPLFIQRAHQINVDSFLFLGWLGYGLFFENFYLSLLFLIIAVMSKSLIGFYPVIVFALFNLYLFFVKKTNIKKLKKTLTRLLIQVLIISSWYLIMFVLFKSDFWQQHIIESHFRRVTSSIEFHFGKRTFYLEMVLEQFGIIGWLAILGFIYSTCLYLKKQTNEPDQRSIHGPVPNFSSGTWVTNSQYLITVFFLPWFIFLNLTKTKIFWYFYPIISQVAFLVLLPLFIFQKKKFIFYPLISFMIFFSLYQAVFKEKFLTSQYSKTDDHYFIAQEAKKYCREINYLIPAQTRNDFATLEKLGLLITSSKGWGNHPSLAYYSQKKVDFIYDLTQFNEKIVRGKTNSCYLLYSEEIKQIAMIHRLTLKDRSGDLRLFQKK